MRKNNYLSYFNKLGINKNIRIKNTIFKDNLENKKINYDNITGSLGRVYAYETSNEFHADSIYTGCDDNAQKFLFSPVFRDEIENNQEIIYRNPANAINNPNMINCVNIVLTGNRRQDYALANLACGRNHDADDKPQGYTWHHVFMGYYAQKYSIEGSLDQFGNPIEYLMYSGADWLTHWTFLEDAYMQLVLTNVHTRCNPHRGSCWQFVQSYNTIMNAYGMNYATDFPNGDYADN